MLRISGRYHHQDTTASYVFEIPWWIKHARKSLWLFIPIVQLYSRFTLRNVSSSLLQLWGPSTSTSEYRSPHWSLRISSALMMMSTSRHSEWNVKQRSDGKGDRFPR